MRIAFPTDKPPTPQAQSTYCLTHPNRHALGIVFKSTDLKHNQKQTSQKIPQTQLIGSEHGILAIALWPSNA